MGEHVDTLRNLLRPNVLDVEAVATVFEGLSVDAGVEVAIVVEQARRAIVEIRAGNRRYRPFLRHSIKRLIVLLEKRAPRDEIAARIATAEGSPL